MVRRGYTPDEWERLRPDQRRDAAVAALYCSLSDETQQRERFEEEVWSAHKWLDERSIPRADVGGEVFSLVGRMTRLVETVAKR